MTSHRATALVVFSHLAGREVSTWSSEWARQCEVDTLLAMPAGQRLRFLNGSGRPEDGRDGRPLEAIRGAAGAATLKADLDRMEEILRARTRPQ
ncbi:hypothetical protein B6S44_28910 [Bosea sp. Tri-44]|uniref:DUF7696 family protein n=1 Tax=Bosea sp. Tri-44 TaxID=1972137 RepID=UPI00100E1C51|nr:hypothetical protein [Bosea sp. Tri-44]RXT43087.1 hypothetical protein B6S44_28910 [Bosea sp. Tri-44]